MMGVDLDTTRQAKLYRRACEDMARKLPGWTDAFPSDPTVAVLEQLSFLSDLQNHVLDRVEDTHFLAYCKLLGASPECLTPAQLLALPTATFSCEVGERFYADGVPFEVTKVPVPGLPRVKRVSLQSEAETKALDERAPLRLAGAAPCGLTVELTGPLEAGTSWTFWCDVTHDDGRNPPAAETRPPVELTAWIRSEGQWRELPCRDGTCGFLKRGPITVTLDRPAGTVALRVTGGWEGTPCLRGVTLEPTELRQQHTRSAAVELTAPFRVPGLWAGRKNLFCFTPCGVGWKEEKFHVDGQGQLTGWEGAPPDRLRVVAAEPDFHVRYTLSGVAMEELSVAEKGVWPEALRVMVEENGLWYDCPVCPPAEGETLPRGCRWIPERGAIRFGDGRDYLPPTPGQALISGCVLTLGSAANGVCGELKSDDGSALAALVPAWGGRDAESPQAAFARAVREQEVPIRAVTCQDYETLALHAPGLALERVRALPRAALEKGNAGVVVLAKPRSRQLRPSLTDWQREQLLNFLEPCRLLGVPLEVRGPRYCPVRVSVALMTSEPVDRARLEQVVRALTDGVEGPLDFGAELSYTALYAALGGVEGVRRVRRLELRPLEEGAAGTEEGGLRLPPDMLPCLEQLVVEEV